MKLQVTKMFEMFDNEIIEKYGPKTNWFNSEIPVSISDLYDVLVLRGFTREQALVIIASLGLVGVQFTDDVIEIED